MAQNDKGQKNQSDINMKDSNEEAEQKIVSENAQMIKYEEKFNTKTVDNSSFLNNLQRSQINYTPASRYQPFSYQVEKVFPSLHFYKIKVKIAHFSLTVSVIKIPQTNILAISERKKSNFSEIYFVKSKEENLCIKSFAFKSNSMFQKLFPTVMKQWTIHRICSALQCGPYISKAFGFDLLIFDDCIQYATQEGEQINGYSKLDAQHLRQQLAILHSFKIMHLDIKPQNTVFSKYFRKPVFIDFGFSEIIKEDFGFKTLIKFKGTPNFCSPQMLGIMLEKEGYVDLYYNDAYSLQQCLNFKKVSVNSAIYLQEEEESQDFQTASMFTIFAFQYHYLDSNTIKTRQLLKQLIKCDERNIKTILLFIKSTMRQTFLREIYEKDLNKFEHLIQYREIKEQIKINSGKFFYKDMVRQERNNEEEDNILQLSSFMDSGESSQNFQRYLRIILSLSKLDAESAINFVSIAFECVRFDVKNLEVFEKKQIADKMNSLLFFYLQIDRKRFQEEQSESLELKEQQTQLLKQIKIMLRLIFQFCLSNSSPWVKKHIFDVCQQMILLKMDFQEYLQRLAVFSDEAYSQPKEMALMVFQFLRLRNTVNLMENQKFKQLQVLQDSINQLIMKWVSKFQRLNERSEEAQTVAIKNLLKALQQKIVDDKFQQMNMKDVEDKQLRKYLLLHLTKSRIDYLIDKMSPDQLLGIVDFTKCSSELKNLDLLSSTIITMSILTGLYNHVEIDAYYSYVCSIINCQVISKSLNIRQKKSFYSPNINFVQDRIRTVIKAYQESTKYYSFQCQILSILNLVNKVNKKYIVKEQLKNSLFELYDLYKRQNQRSMDIQMNSSIQTRSFMNAFYYIQLQYQFCRFSDQCQDVLMMNLRNAERIYQNIDKLSFSELSEKQKLQKVFIHYKITMYQFHYYLLNNQLKKGFRCLDLVQELLKCLKISFILFEIVKFQVDLAVRSKNLLFITQATNKLYNICCQANFKSFYLVPRNSTQFYISLVVFQSSNQPLFYAFLNELTKFFVDHPIECYFQTLLSAIDRFIAFNPSRSYSIHYNRLIGQDGLINLKDNPYLLIFYVYSLRNEEIEIQLKLYKIIIFHCERLCLYAKKRVLERSLGIYFEYLKCKSQQHRFFNFKMVKTYLSEKKKKLLFQFPKKINSKLNTRNEPFITKLKRYRIYLV